jgi:hypothetical protein
MIIKVVISEETWARMLTGKRVEGALSYDKWTGVKAFKAYNRKASEPGSDRLVRKLPWGWVKESKMRVKVHESLPKSMGLERMLSELAVEHNVVCEALVDEAIVNRV